MKRLLLLTWTLSIILSGCKKNNSTPPTPIDNSFLNATGLVQSTELGLQNIPFIENFDTSLIPLFTRLTDLPPSAYEDVPDPGSQGSYNSCVGWAVGYGMLGYLYKHIEGHSDYNGSDRNFSPSYIWNQLNGGGNNGISFGSALELVKSQGCCKQTDMQPILAPTIQPSTIANSEAAKYKLTQYFRFTRIDINIMKKWLSRGYPIMIGIYVDAAFTKMDASPFERQSDGRLVWKRYTNTDRSKQSGHAVLICGYDNSINAFKVLNSWGINWGDSGYIWIDYNFFNTAVESTDGSKPEIYIGYTKRPIVSTNVITGITQTSAKSGGTILLPDWGIPPTSRGVCWNTTSNPTTANSKTSDGTGTGTYVSNISGLTANTTYYLKAYATNSVGTSYGTEITFTTSSAPVYTIGQNYGGGIIFYLDGTLQHGLITSASDLTDAGGVNTSIDWSNGSNVVTSANGTAIGTGLANTNTIVTVQGTGNYAAKICRNYSNGGFTDWYLPSKDELTQLYINKNTVGTFGGLTTYSYWSSTEASASQAWAQNFQNSGSSPIAVNKSGFGVPRVRAVRTF